MLYIGIDVAKRSHGGRDGRQRRPPSSRSSSKHAEGVRASARAPRQTKTSLPRGRWSAWRPRGTTGWRSSTSSPPTASRSPSSTPSRPTRGAGSTPCGRYTGGIDALLIVTSCAASVEPSALGDEATEELRQLAPVPLRARAGAHRPQERATATDLDRCSRVRALFADKFGPTSSALLCAPRPPTCWRTPGARRAAPPKASAAGSGARGRRGRRGRPLLGRRVLRLLGARLRARCSSSAWSSPRAYLGAGGGDCPRAVRDRRQGT